MRCSCFESIFLIILCGLVRGYLNLDYSDLQAMNIACPERDRCAGYRNNLSYMERSCECDFACAAYKDCCIDASRRRSSGRDVIPTDMVCMHYGENAHTGVYAIARCSNSWNGPQRVRQKCEGAPDYSDPLSAAPATSVPQAVTYKNLYCAECNNANLQSLTLFQLMLSCDGLEDLTQEQIMGDLFYNRQRNSWGIDRLDDQGYSNFMECEIIYDVPGYLNRSVRFCRSGIISTCARNWTRIQVKRECEEYMAVVFGNLYAYRNPHCALCNHKTIDDLTCRSSLLGRKRPMSFALLLDVNQSDGDQVGMTQVATPECPSGHKYDPFFKRCRRLVCALPGYTIVNGRCAPGG